MANTLSNRRFEMGLPLFSGLDLGMIFSAQEKLSKGGADGLSTFIVALGNAGKTHTIRQLSAIWTASDIELEQAEVDQKVMDKLVKATADKLFSETFKDAMDFHSALFGLLGVSHASSSSPTELGNETGKSQEILVVSPSVD